MEEPVVIDRQIKNLTSLVLSESYMTFALQRYAIGDVDVISHMTWVSSSQLLETLQSEEWDYPIILNWIVRFFTLLHRSLLPFISNYMTEWGVDVLI